MTWLGNAAHNRWLETETDRLLAFGTKSWQEAEGFGWLDDDGTLDTDQPLQLWVNCRMVHCFALGTLLGRPGYARMVDGGLDVIGRSFADAKNGGWYSQVASNGDSVKRKEAYPHAFVVLAAASALAAGRPAAADLLDQALAVQDEWFWDEDAGMVRESWDKKFTVCDEYRGVNANMHTVEAYLAASAVTGQDIWRDRASRILERVFGFARDNEWRIPEHFDSAWRPDMEFNADAKADPFRPYGATIGHSFEWARLALHLAAAIGEGADVWMLDGAVALFDQATREGWAVDGAPGFVYTVDWQGEPVVHSRMHWVVCEAIAAAAALHQVTGENRYADRYQEWWEYAARYVIDRNRGSWRHELNKRNAPSSDVWQGKPDIYHAVQATLIPRLPLAPALSVALRDGLLS